MNTTAKLDKLSEEEMVQIIGGKWILINNQWTWIIDDRSLPDNDGVPPPPPALPLP